MAKKVFFIGERAFTDRGQDVALGCGDYPRPRGPYRSLTEAQEEARAADCQCEVIIYEAVAIESVRIELKREISAYSMEVDER